jgi:hypothetical protein
MVRIFFFKKSEKKFGRLKNCYIFASLNQLNHLKMNTQIKNLAKVIEEKKQTLDYQNYTMLDEVSRKVDDTHVKKIMLGMATFGAEATCLIVIETTAFGEVQRILADGNHRSKSARLLGLPLDIKVIKLNDDTQENVRDYISCLNNNSKGWSNLTYLRLNVVGGKREYIKFHEIMEETKLRITDLLFIYTGSGNTKEFQLGKLTFKDEKESDKTLVEVKRMLKVLPKHTYTRRGLWGIMKKVKVKAKTNYKELATAIINFSKNTENQFSADEKTFKSQLIEIYDNTFTK